MSAIDYTKLKPWHIVVEEPGRESTMVVRTNGTFVGAFNRRADAELVCLERAAAEVQQRRRWGVFFHSTTHVWFVLDNECKWLWMDGKYFKDSDPATAIVLADAWAKEHGI